MNYEAVKPYGGNTASIDKMIDKLGCCTGNIRWVSHRGNKLKSDATLEEAASVFMGKC